MSQRGGAKGRHKTGILPFLYGVIIAVVVIAIATTAIYLASFSKPSASYVAVLQVQNSNNKTDFNYLNIVKDGALIAGASAALGVCTTGTFGACVAAVPTVATALRGVLDDEIMTVKSDFTFSNIGNGTARSITYNVGVYSDDKLVKIDASNLPDLEPGKQEVVTYSHRVTLADIAIGAWDAIQGKGKITLTVLNLHYSGGLS
ncbi:MAG: hypothetical protein HYU39_02170 [Thaumarchaeota archaeon]|nr:hypothetical protein [Nitrososphaerota archaeon]